jgi:hypothetical protein
VMAMVHVAAESFIVSGWWIGRVSEKFDLKLH